MKTKGLSVQLSARYYSLDELEDIVIALREERYRRSHARKRRHALWLLERFNAVFDIDVLEIQRAKSRGYKPEFDVFCRVAFDEVGITAHALGGALGLHHSTVFVAGRRASDRVDNPTHTKYRRLYEEFGAELQRSGRRPIMK